MSQTNRYLRWSPDRWATDMGVVENSATDSTDGTYVELRVLITKSDGSTATTLTTFQIMKAFDAFKRYLIRGGVNEFQNGTGHLPLPGPSP